MDSGESLLASAQRGDRRALEMLLQQHRPAVVRHGLRYCPSKDDAEDAAQETLWAATRSLSAFRRAAAITTWLFAIVRNFCLHLHKKEQKGTERAALPGGDRGASQDHSGSAEARRALAQAFAKLEPWQREVI